MARTRAWQLYDIRVKLDDWQQERGRSVKPGNSRHYSYRCLVWRRYLPRDVEAVIYSAL